MPRPADKKTTTPAATEPPPRVTFAAGGWVLLLMALFAIALMTWALWPVFTRERPPGDGRNPQSYLFDLDHSRIPIDEIVLATLHRGMIPVMDDPPILDGSTLSPEAVADDRRKLLVTGDRIIGVHINGEARAYPISVLTVHEIINDTLGGEPIAVTYHWPSDAAQVFDRRIGDRTVRFDVSGLLYNGNMLLYPRNDDEAAVGGESLYSQLLARAVTGEDAREGITLRIIPAQLTSWGDWLAAHPDTTVADRDPSLSRKRYEQGDPGPYRMNDDIKFPPPPHRMPPADGWAPKTQMTIVQVVGRRRVYPLPLIRQYADAEGIYEDELGGEVIRFRYDHASLTVEVTTAGGAIPTLYHAYWFAWFAMHPEDEVASG